MLKIELPCKLLKLRIRELGCIIAHHLIGNAKPGKDCFELLDDLCARC